MNIFPFHAISDAFDISGSVANSRKALSELNFTVPAPTGVEYTMRVVNESAAAALFSMGDSTIDATTDPKRMSVPAGQERIFALEAGCTHVAAALRSGTGTVQVQVGTGV